MWIQNKNRLERLATSRYIFMLQVYWYNGLETLFIQHTFMFLNQACAWFLEIAFGRNVGMCVCVSAPEAINN